MAIKSLQVLYLGSDIMDKRLITYRMDEGKMVETAFLGYLIRTDDGNILVDAGFHPEDIKKALAIGRQINVRTEDQMPQRLKEAGLAMEDIKMVIMTHLHRDHVGWLEHLRHAEIIIQKEEYLAAINPAPYTSSFYVVERYNFPDMKWRLVDGDKILLPGLTILFTPGHSAGSQSIMVDLPKSGTILLVGDAGHIHENFVKELTPGIFIDPAQAMLSIKRLNVWSQIRKAPIFPAHDLDYWREHMIKSPETYT
ncbi:N-acyl homoserine lactonase family protein [Chloroflexota bacterium]